MSQLTRRGLLSASAAAVATAFHAGSSIGAEKPTEVEWTEVHVNLAYLKSQKAEIQPAVKDLEALFPRRVPVELGDNFPGLPGFMFYLEITGKELAAPSWTFIHDGGGSLLFATDVEQLSIALKHLNNIARKGPLRDEKHPAYPRGIPLVVSLPIGVTTSMPVHQVT